MAWSDDRSWDEARGKMRGREVLVGGIGEVCGDAALREDVGEE